MNKQEVEIGEEGIQKMMSSAALSGPWMIPLLVGLREQKLEINFAHRDGKVQRLRPAVTEPQPMVIIIGDDDGDDRGPSGWPASISRTIARSQFIMLNASGGQAEHYAMAMQMALALGSALIIETASRHVPAWSEMLRGRPVLAVLPRGGQHPIDTRESRH